MTKLKKTTIYLANPRGFCAGVVRAIDIVERALKKYGPPVYVRHEIVHNKYVVENLKNKGAIFVDELEDIPDNSITIFSAHGVSAAVENEAIARDLPSIDATCPLVKKVHKEAQRHEEEGCNIILIGHKNHAEVEGTSGRVKGIVHLVQNIDDVNKLDFKIDDKIAYITQTTLSVDDTKGIIRRLKERYPTITGPELKDICYATQNRQDAVKTLASLSDIILVIGAKNSSNSNRLCDLGQEMGVRSYLIDGPEDIDETWFNNHKSIGITAGASAPEVLLERVIEKLKEFFVVDIKNVDGVVENVKFRLPKQLENI